MLPRRVTMGMCGKVYRLASSASLLAAEAAEASLLGDPCSESLGEPCSDPFGEPLGDPLGDPLGEPVPDDFVSRAQFDGADGTDFASEAKRMLSMREE